MQRAREPSTSSVLDAAVISERLSRAREEFQHAAYVRSLAKKALAAAKLRRANELTEAHSFKDASDAVVGVKRMRVRQPAPPPEPVIIQRVNIKTRSVLGEICSPPPKQALLKRPRQAVAVAAVTSARLAPLGEITKH